MIKINALVDKDIVPLVQALNSFDCVLTVDSCQGDNNNAAYVYFVYAGEHENEVRFFYWLANELRKKTKCDYEFTISWLSENKNAMAKLLTQPQHINSLSMVIEGLYLMATP